MVSARKSSALSVCNSPPPGARPFPLAPALPPSLLRTQVLATYSSTTECASELAACLSDYSCSACLYGEAENCVDPDYCSHVEEWVCCIAPEDCHDESLLFDYAECIFEDVCGYTNVSCGDDDDGGSPGVYDSESPDSDDDSESSDADDDSESSDTETYSGAAGIMTGRGTTLRYVGSVALGAIVAFLA